jgi:uncharacterized protein
LRLGAVGLIVAAVGLMALGIVLDEADPAVAAEGPGFPGGFADVLAARLAMLPLATTVVLLFNGPVAFSAFCAGLAAWKSGFLEPGNPGFAKLRARAPLLAALGLAGSLCSSLAAHGTLGDGLAALAGYAAQAVGGPALAAVYLLLLVTAARSDWLPAGFVAVGRMSLTAYILQGTVAGFVFYGYGLGLYGQFGAVGVFLAAVAVFAVVHAFCALWLRFARLGPLEWVLRGFMNALSRPAPAAAG